MIKIIETNKSGIVLDVSDATSSQVHQYLANYNLVYMYNMTANLIVVGRQ